MIRKPPARVLCLAALAAGALLAAWYPAAGQDRKKSPAPPAPASAGGKAEAPAVASVRGANRAYGEAFNRGDAKALAALWTENGEYDGPDAVPVRGRAALEAAYARFFRENPGATLEAGIESVRLLGPRAAVEEGTLRSGLGKKPAGGETRFSAFLVLEEGGWRLASVREWVPEDEERVSLEDLAWLAGEWAAKGKEREARLSYTMDENKAFLRGRYSVSQGGKVVSSGTQVIGKDPNGGLRSWQFETDGGFGEWAWSRDGERWVIQGEGTEPDGDVETAANLLIPLDKDSFTWQVLEHTSGGVVRPARPPVKVTRVKADK
jgi:uncharacterized protein (TIGR02246 family)